MLKRPSTMLDDLAIFAETDHQTRRRAARMFTKLNVDAGHTFLQNGQTGREFFLIVSGHATVVRDGHTIAELGPSDFFGEVSLISLEVRNATVTSSEPMTVLAANRREFGSLLRLDPAFAAAIRSAADCRAA